MINKAIYKKKINWRLEDLVDYKEVLGWLSGAAIAVVWISYALLSAGNTMFLVVAISLTILLGTLSGGLIKLSTKSKKS
ncbi:MAG: hypothetical protein WBH31_02680 [Promethearchaeia archaeon]